MKNSIVVAICFLLFSQTGLSQTEPRVIQYTKSITTEDIDTFFIVKEEYYEYNSINNLSSISTKEYNNSGKLLKWEGVFYEYGSNQLLKKESFKYYNSDVDLWITEEYIDYKYDLNNCLIEEIKKRNVGGYIFYKTDYIVDDNCNLVSRSLYRPDLLNDSILILDFTAQRSYFQDGISYEDKTYYYEASGDSTYLGNWGIFIFDENKNLIKLQIGYGDNPSQFMSYQETKRIMEYDEFNNLVTSEVFRRNSDTAEWNLSIVYNHYNVYDRNGFLIENRNESVSYNSTPPTSSLGTIRKYKNSCEGLIEIIDRIYSPNYQVKEEYIYEGLNECFDFEKIELDIQVFPNPSNGYFEISSPIFKTGNTEIVVYTIDGKVLLQKAENSRSTSSSIDLSFLQNGFYLLHLRNGDHFVKEKIVIAK